MEDLERTTEFSPEQEETGGDPERVVDAQESRYEDEEILNDGQEQAVDAQESGEETEPEEKEQPAPRQTREENAAIRAARLNASREARETAMREADAEIAAAGIMNPYTKKPFSSMKDFRDYAAQVRKAQMEEEAARTGRSIEVLEEEEENRKFLTQLRKQSQGQPEPEEEKGFLIRDLNDFMEKHPEMNVEKLEALEKNKTFRRFCGSRFGREPLADLYDSYLEIVSESGSAAVAKAASKADRSTGGGSSGGVTLTPSQQKELDAWNRANPDMPMTAQEFLQ